MGININVKNDVMYTTATFPNTNCGSLVSVMVQMAAIIENRPRYRKLWSLSPRCFTADTNARITNTVPNTNITKQNIRLPMFSLNSLKTIALLLPSTTSWRFFRT